MNLLDELFKSAPLYLLPAPPYLAVYLADICMFVYGIRFIIGRTFPYSAYTYGFAVLAFQDILLYPTDRSEINVTSLGEYFYHRYMTVIDQALVLVSVGFWVLVLTVRFGNRLTRVVSLGFIGQSVRTALFSSNFANILVVLQVLLLVLMIATGISLFSASHAGFENTSLRPIVVTGTYLGGFCLTIFFGRLFFKRSLKNAIYLASSILFALTLGARATVFGPLLLFVFYSAWWSGNRNIIRYVVYLVAFLALAHLADLLRAGAGANGGLGLNSFIASVFYGNSFSDLRDFALILSGFNTLLWGKTYAAAFLGFIPSFLFPLRQAWNWGPTSLMLSGLYVIDPNHVHPGMRGTFVGEPYVNFGIAGLLAISVLLGLFLLYDHVGVREALQRRDKAEFIVRMVRYEFISGIVGVLSDTAGLSYIYFLMAMLALASILRKG